MKRLQILDAPPSSSRSPAPAAADDAPPLDRELASALLADSESGILLLDPEGRVEEVNAAGLKLLGVTAARARRRPASDLIRTVIPGDDPLEGVYRVKRLEREIVCLSADGAEFPVLLRSYRLGRPAQVLITLRDLTQSRRMQQELRRHERLATLGQLSAGVAHEIRNPLAGIGTSAQVLLRRFEPRDERARFVQVILDEVARLDRIVTSLLQYARPRVPELEPSALGPCIDRVIGLNAETLQSAGVQVEAHVAPRLSPVYIDRDLVAQVLLNVTLNAIQAMPQGGVLRYDVQQVRRRRPSRSAGRRNTDREGRARAAGTPGWFHYQQIRVTDTGVGMPRSVLAKLFDPFFSTKPKGTGLGLSISQTIMHEHGGSIEVASREGRGTTVLLNFPVEKRHAQRREPYPDTARR